MKRSVLAVLGGEERGEWERQKAGDEECKARVER